jgi:DNA-binding response OmpR family regulator
VLRLKAARIPPNRHPYELIMKRLLIVEDEEADYKSVTEALAADAYDLTRTRTGHEALWIANDERFDMALLGLNISDMNPWAALDFLNVLHPFLPVILLSHETSQVPRAVAHGADVCLVKPIDAETLRKTIQQLLEESHQARMTRRMYSLRNWFQPRAACLSLTWNGLEETAMTHP